MKPKWIDSYGNEISEEAYQKHRKLMIELSAKYWPIIQQQQKEDKGA